MSKLIQNILFFFFIFGVVSCHKSMLELNPPTFKSVESNIQILSKENQINHYLDSLVLVDETFLKDIITIANPIQFDSIYNQEIYDLIGKVIEEKNFEKQKKYITQILEYGSEGYVCIQEFEKSDQQEIKYWGNVVKYLTARFGSRIDRSAARIPINRWVQTQKNPQILTLFREEVISAWEKGVPNEMYFRPFLGMMVEATLKIKEDAFHEPYQRVIDLEDKDKALWMVSSIGARSRGNFTPEVFLRTLKNEHPEIVSEAISWVSSARDVHKNEKIRQYQKDIFDGDNEELKFKVCFSLMYKYQDDLAINYLLEQATSKDFDRKMRAIGWLGDACNANKTMSEEMFAILTPNLKDKDARMRRRTVETLSTYRGEKIINAIIPFLISEMAVVANGVRYRLKNGREDPQLILDALESFLLSENNPILLEAIKKMIVEIKK